MDKLIFDYSKAESFILNYELDYQEKMVEAAHYMLHQKTGPGNDFLGWVDLPMNYDKEEFDRIKKASKRIQDNSEVLIVIGIGGSYLGARAAIEFLGHSFYSSLPRSKRKHPEVYFVGNNISAMYISNLLEAIEGRDISINVISKSGTTTEPAIAFRIFKEYMEKKYGKEEAVKRIYATTDKQRGALKTLADEEGYETFVIPDDVGGRYSVLTAVGLLPIAVSGADIDKLMEGAKDAYDKYNNPFLKDNPCYQYAAVRNALYKKGKTIEIMVGYHPQLKYIQEWWKQLFGESEGKDNKGIFTASVEFSTDLHSLGQYIQEGIRNIFETIVDIKDIDGDIIIPEDKNNIDGLNFLKGKSIDYVNKKALQGTMLAHTDGGVPNLMVTIDKRDEYCLGNLIYFYEKACGISGYLLGVNPFDQPGVEAYKKNMFALLGKPGYEEEKVQLEKRLI